MTNIHSMLDFDPTVSKHSYSARRFVMLAENPIPLISGWGDGYWRIVSVFLNVWFPFVVLYLKEFDPGRWLRVISNALSSPSMPD